MGTIPDHTISVKSPLVVPRLSWPLSPDWHPPDVRKIFEFNHTHHDDIARMKAAKYRSHWPGHSSSHLQLPEQGAEFNFGFGARSVTETTPDGTKILYTYGW